MYYFFDLIDETNKIKRHIFQYTGDGKGFSFPLETDSGHVNDYLAWIAEGNTAEEWTDERAAGN